MRRIHVALILVAIALVLSSGDLRAQKPANGRILMVTQSAGFRHGSVNRGDKPLSPAERVMTELKNLDEVAYVRFASVYRQFKDIGEFQAQIEDLKD